MGSVQENSTFLGERRGELNAAAAAVELGFYLCGKGLSLEKIQDVLRRALKQFFLFSVDLTYK